MSSQTIDLELKPLIRELVTRTLVRNVTDAVEGAITRDALLADLHDQLEMRLPPTGKLPWPNACDLNDPLTAEAHLELLSLLTQAQRKSPWWQVDAYSPDDEENARVTESWLDNKVAQYGLKGIIYNVAFNALRDPVGILYVGWEQNIKTSRVRKYVHSQDPDGTDGIALDAEERDENEDYTPVWRETQTLEFQGCKFRTPDVADIYVYPPDAQSLATAQGVAERMLLSEDELLDGVAKYGYDQTEVDKLLAAGPTHATDEALAGRERKASQDGVNGESKASQDGFYEVFLYFGRLPRMRTSVGTAQLPAQYLTDDAMCMICPAHSIIFQMEMSPYPDRPYIAFYMIAKPNRLYGIGVGQLVQPLQEEATITLQATVNAMNLDMTPALIGPSDWNSKYNKFSVFPGAVMPEDEKGDLRPLEWGRKSPLGLELHENLVQRGKGLVAARGYGELQSKVREKSEIANVMQATDAKFDLFLQIFQTSMEELAARIVSLHAHFLGDDGKDEFHTPDKQPHIVTAQTLRASFRYTATATSSNNTPESRLAVAQGKQGAQMAYFNALATMNPAFHKAIWHGARQILLDLNERNPEEWIGPEPQSIPPEVQSLVQALIQSGVPPQQIMQAMQQTGMQGGAPGAAPSPPVDLAQAAQQVLPRPPQAPMQQ